MWNVTKYSIAIMVLLAGVAVYSIDSWIYSDFDESMKTASFSEAISVTQKVVGLDGTALMHFFRDLYNKNNLSKISSQTELRIPKIIHQIWLGSELPETFRPYMNSWFKHHHGWSYILWTEKEVKKLKLYNQKYYDAVDCYGAKSDILRWEILYKFGGVYIDMDYECLKPLDILHYSYDFYTGIQPLDSLYVQLGAALVGSIPGHPILKHCMETIKDDWHKKGAPAKTGPVHFTKSFFAAADQGDNLDIALPATYLYPLGCRETAVEDDDIRDKWLQSGAYAVHHWAKSWMPLEYRKGLFKKINNYTFTKTWND